MNIDLADKYVYIPAFNNNRNLDSPIEIECEYLSSTEKKKAIKQEVQSEAGQPSKVITTYDEDILIKCSRAKIKNLAVNGIEVKTGEELIATRGLASLVSELASEIILRNAVPDLKN